MAERPTVLKLRYHMPIPIRVRAGLIYGACPIDSLQRISAQRAKRTDLGIIGVLASAKTYINCLWN